MKAETVGHVLPRLDASKQHTDSATTELVPPNERRQNRSPGLHTVKRRAGGHMLTSEVRRKGSAFIASLEERGFAADTGVSRNAGNMATAAVGNDAGETLTFEERQSLLARGAGHIVHIFTP